MSETWGASAKWREAGEPDPHGARYNCPREETTGGHLTDDELANHVFMDGLDGDCGLGKAVEDKLGRQLSPDMIRSFGRSARLNMQKDRIRWLSRRLSSRDAEIARLEQRVRELEEETESKAGKALRGVRACFQKRSDWTVDGIIYEVGAAVSTKQVYNALGYLTRHKQIERLHYGEYRLLASTTGERG